MMQNETTALHNKTVDRFNQEKLYIQLTKIFLDEINSGRWQLDQKIPTEEELCKKYNVSKITVRQALNNLVADGYLLKIQGKGTFVSSVLPVVGPAMKTRLTEDMFGKEVKVEKEVLFSGVKESLNEARNYLKTNDRIYYILCRRTVNGEPAYLEESFIPCLMIPGIEQLDIACSPVYSVLQEMSIKKIFKAVQTIEISRAAGDYAKNLDADAGMPLLVVHRLLLSSDGIPVAYTKFTGKSDKYKFQTEFERVR